MVFTLGQTANHYLPLTIPSGTHDYIYFPWNNTILYTVFYTSEKSAICLLGIIEQSSRFHTEGDSVEQVTLQMDRTVTAMNTIKPTATPVLRCATMTIQCHKKTPRPHR